jgi:hypothetical protein
MEVTPNDSDELDLLKYIASSDNLIKLCSTDIEIARKYRNLLLDDMVVAPFDPIISIASNSELLNTTFDFWSLKSGKKIAEKNYKTFDYIKYTRFYIKARFLFLKDDQNKEYKSTGFDCYAYLMAYEEDILTKYEATEFNVLDKLQKAALHYVEFTYDVKQLDYLIYVASYDDLVSVALNGKPVDILPEAWIIESGKQHYENTGRKEIHDKHRPVEEFFDPWKYIASYSETKDIFWNFEENTLNETNATLAFITNGSKHGLFRNIFVPDVYLANYPERVKDDIYTNSIVSEHKVAKLWLKNFPGEAVLDAFDHLKFAEEFGIENPVDSFKEFVKKQVLKFDTLSKKKRKVWFKVKNMICGSLKVSKKK